MKMVKNAHENKEIMKHENTMRTNDNVELVFAVTSEGKASKLHGKVDWELCWSKSANSLFGHLDFLAQYSSQSTVKEKHQEVRKSFLLPLFSLGNRGPIQSKNTIGDCELLFAA